MEPLPDFAAFRRNFFALVEKAEHVVITAHYSPDDDSIGSVLSVYTILTTTYPAKDIRIVYTGAPSERHSVFSQFEKIEFVTDVGNELGRSDLLIMLDANQYARFSKVPELLQQVPQTIAIDHHASTPDMFTLSLVVPNFSSNCELIYRALDAESMLSKSLAEYFLLGILGDTGNFAYVTPGQSDVFLVAKKLVSTIGVSIDSFRARYGGIPKHIIPLLQELVKNTTYESMPGWPDFQYSYIDRSVLQTGPYTDEDMSAASHIYMGQYLPRVLDYGWGFVLTPRADGGVRMSGRSLATSVNVRDMHERLGIGSGHDRAAGGNFKKETVDREPKQCIVEVLTWMQLNTPLIGT
jgi:nanoRNase/pAp phosphatase (c-di-AMP/oligoRNAs hydrolase)